MEQLISEYEKQAQDFLNKTNTKLDLTYITSDPQESSCFNDGKQRDVYQVRLTRGSRTYSFKFAQSLACSGKYGNGSIRTHELPRKLNKPSWLLKQDGWFKNTDFEEPTAYDILCCLTKHDPGDFEWFCSDFGYDTDSIKANETYKAVKDEYQNMCILFSDEELEELQEIN